MTLRVNWKKLFKSLLMVVFATVGLYFSVYAFVFFVGGMLFGYENHCTDEVIQTISLDKGKIELHQGNCGATTDFTYELQWSNNEGQTETISFLDIEYGEIYFEVMKESKDKIILNYTPGTKIKEKNLRINDLQIIFEERKVKIDMPKDFISMKRSFKGDGVDFYRNYIEVYKEPHSIKNQMGYSIDYRGFENPNYDTDFFNFGFVQANDNEILSALFTKNGEKNYPVYIEDETGEKIKIASSYQNFEHVVSLIKSLPYGKDYCDNPAKDKKLEKKRNEILTEFVEKNADASIDFWQQFIPSKPYRKSEACGF